MRDAATVASPVLGNLSFLGSACWGCLPQTQEIFFSIHSPTLGLGFSYQEPHSIGRYWRRTGLYFPLELCLADFLATCYRIPVLSQWNNKCLFRAPALPGSGLKAGDTEKAQNYWLGWESISCSQPTIWSETLWHWCQPEPHLRSLEPSTLGMSSALFPYPIPAINWPILPGFQPAPAWARHNLFPSTHPFPRGMRDQQGLLDETRPWAASKIWLQGEWTGNCTVTIFADNSLLPIFPT